MRLLSLLLFDLSLAAGFCSLTPEDRDATPANVVARAEPPPVQVAPRPAAPVWTEVKGTGRAAVLTTTRPSRWEIAEESGAEVLPTPDGKSATLVVTDPRLVRVKLFVIALDEPQSPARVVVVLDGSGPNPSPDPDPPPVPPGPKVDRLWLIVVEETGERAPAVAKVLGDGAYWTGLATKNHKWRFYDKDSQEAVSRGYVRQAQTVGLPALILIDQATGKPVKTIKLPADTTGVDAAINEVTR